MSVDPDGKHGPQLREDLRDAWREAFRGARPDRRGVLDHRLTEWIKRLVVDDPALVVDWIEARLAEAGPHGYDVVPWHAETLLERLPRAERDGLLRRRGDGGERQYFLGLLIGSDAEWVESLLKSRVVVPSDVLYGLCGVHGAEFKERQRQFEAIAAVLVDAGVEPEVIASTAEFGGGWGEDSVRYASLCDYFEKLADSPDRRLADIGQASHERYRRLREKAAQEERRARIEQRD